jgi:hypothetical protein
MVETITTSDRVKHTVVTTTRTNVQEIITDDRPQDIAPTPRCAAQVITTETLHHSMKRKEILDNLLDYHAPCSTT